MAIYNFQLGERDSILNLERRAHGQWPPGYINLVRRRIFGRNPSRRVIIRTTKATNGIFVTLTPGAHILCISRDHSDRNLFFVKIKPFGKIRILHLN